MPKPSSTGCAAAKRKPSRKGAATARKRPGLDEIAIGSGNPPREEDVTQHTEVARELVLAAWPGIVQGLIKKAKGGGYQQTKLLLDLCEITGTDTSQLNDQRRRQLCDALLEGLGLQAVQSDQQTDNVGPGDDAKTSTYPAEPAKDDLAHQSDVDGRASQTHTQDSISDDAVLTYSAENNRSIDETEPGEEAETTKTHDD
ncbi:MAG: hypothetical protein ABI164_07410, partial [Acidobacteriaceae bacterium]